ncbi:MAG: methyltransferase [Archaeoglobus sp.]|nr:methyltransferase [Archaeoglobus sp.]
MTEIPEIPEIPEMLNFLLKNPRTDPKPLMDIIEEASDGFRKVCVLNTAIEVGIFEELKLPKSIDELSETLKCDKKLLSILCEVLRDLNLVSKQGEVYQNTEMANEFLTKNSAYSQIPFIEHRINNLSLWLELSEIVKKGPIRMEAERFFSDRVLDSIAQNSLLGEIQRTVSIVSSYPEFKKARKLLDLGGGHGLYSIAFTALNENLHAYVFDLPHVVWKTREYLHKFKVERVDVIPGNFFIDELGDGYDLVFSSYNPGGKKEELIPKIYSSLNANGLYVNKQYFPDNVEGTQNRRYSLLDLEWNLWTFDGMNKGEKAYTFKNDLSLAEYLKKLEDVGFKILDVIGINRDDKIIVAKKVR